MTKKIASRERVAMLARVAIALVVALAALGVGTTAHAQKCKTSVWVDLAFGSYDPLDTGNLDSVGFVTVRCAQTMPVLIVKLDAGRSGSFVPRAMTNGGDDLAYNIYANAARTLVWGDGSSGTTYLGASPFPRGTAYAYAYGRAPLGQDVSGGTYSDSVIVTIEF